jgi:hypothetical protein
MVSAPKLAGVAVVAVTLGVVGAAAFGVGPVSPAVPPSGGAATDTPDATGPDSGSSGGGGGGGSDGDTTATAEPAPFGFQIDSIETCGTTCRDVTATLTNQRDTAASDVTVTTRIYVESDQIWQGSEEIGRLAAGESATTTKRVELGYLDAAKVQNNDGYITVETTVATAEDTYTFSGRRQVA